MVMLNQIRLSLGSSQKGLKDYFTYSTEIKEYGDSEILVSWMVQNPSLLWYWNLLILSTFNLHSSICLDKLLISYLCGKTVLSQNRSGRARLDQYNSFFSFYRCDSSSLRYFSNLLSLFSLALSIRLISSIILLGILQSHYLKTSIASLSYRWVMLRIISFFVRNLPQIYSWILAKSWFHWHILFQIYVLAQFKHLYPSIQAQGFLSYAERNESFGFGYFYFLGLLLGEVVFWEASFSSTGSLDWLLFRLYINILSQIIQNILTFNQFFRITFWSNNQPTPNSALHIKHNLKSHLIHQTHNKSHFQPISGLLWLISVTAYQQYHIFLTNRTMLNRSQIRPYQSGFSFTKSKSTNNFFRLPSQRSININHDSFHNQTKEQCLACNHEKAHGEKKAKNLIENNKSKLRQTNAEEYYPTQDKQMDNLKKTKRFLQELLQKNRNQLRKNTEQYEQKVFALTQGLEQKTQQLNKLQISYNQLQAQQQYQANASLVRSYKQIALNNQDEQQTKNRKLKELAKKNTQLQQELAQTQRQVEHQRIKTQSLEQKIEKVRDYQYYAQEYEAMRGLIGKMEMQKLQLLDKHQDQLERQQNKFKLDIQQYQMRISELKYSNQSKAKEIELLDKELKQIKTEISAFKSNQFHNLKELLDQKDRDCETLQSKISCIQSQLNFLKGRYGYLLKLARNDQLGEQNQNEEYCIERVGRFNISAGKESLLGMNMSPIRRR